MAWLHSLDQVSIVRERFFGDEISDAPPIPMNRRSLTYLLLLSVSLRLFILAGLLARKEHPSTTETSSTTERNNNLCSSRT